MLQFSRLAFWLASWPTWLVSSSVKTSWLSSPKDSLRAPLFLWTKFSMSFLFLEKPQDWWNSLCRWPPQNLVRLKILVDWPTHDKVWFCRNGVWCYVAIKHIVYSKVSPFSTQGLHIFSMSQWSKYIFSYFIIPIVIPGVGSYCPGWRKWLWVCSVILPFLPVCLTAGWPHALCLRATTRRTALGALCPGNLFSSLERVTVKHHHHQLSPGSREPYTNIFIVSSSGSCDVKCLVLS